MSKEEEEECDQPDIFSVRLAVSRNRNSAGKKCDLKKKKENYRREKNLRVVSKKAITTINIKDINKLESYRGLIAEIEQYLIDELNIIYYH